MTPMTDEELEFVAVLVDATISEFRRRVATTGAVTVVTANAPDTTAGALLPEGKTAPENLDGIGSPSMSRKCQRSIIDDVPSNPSLAACVTTREHSGTAEPQKIYGRRGDEASLDGGPVARVSTG